MANEDSTRWLLEQAMRTQKAVAILILFRSVTLACALGLAPMAYFVGPVVLWTLLPVLLITTGIAVWMARWKEG